MPNRIPRFRSYREFWPYYVGEHRRPACRAVHYLAAVAVLAVVTTAIVELDATWLLVAPLVGYGPAWLAHACIEHNRPATWGWVWWSLRAEYEMFGRALVGRMRSEVVRLYGSPAPAPEAPLLVDE